MMVVLLSFSCMLSLDEHSRLVSTYVALFDFSLLSSRFLFTSLTQARLFFFLLLSHYYSEVFLQLLLLYSLSFTGFIDSNYLSFYLSAYSRSQKF